MHHLTSMNRVQQFTQSKGESAGQKWLQRHIDHDGFADLNELVTYDHSIASKNVEVFFRNLKEHLLEQILSADMVIGAVAWITDLDILMALAQKETLLVVQKEDFLRPDLQSALTASDKATLHQAYDALQPFDGRKVPIGPFAQALYPDKLAHLAPVRSFGYCVPTQMYRVPKMHNKFLAFLQHDENDTYQPTSVWTGSLNFTAMSLNSLENAIVIHDPEIAEAFICEAQIIYLKGDPLNWESDWINPWTARDAVTTEHI